MTGGDNIYDQSTRKWKDTTNIHVQWHKLDTLKNLKLHFKMLQNISFIVCLKMATKSVMIFPSQIYLNGVLDAGVSNIFYIKLFMNTLI